MLDKAIEQRQQIMRPGTRFRVSLKAESRLICQGDALQRAIEQGAMRRNNVIRQGRLIDGKTMILAGDHHLPAFEVLHRVIRTVMPELHFLGLGTGSQSQQLMPEADAKYRNRLVQECLESPLWRSHTALDRQGHWTERFRPDAAPKPHPRWLSPERPSAGSRDRKAAAEYCALRQSRRRPHDTARFFDSILAVCGQTSCRSTTDMTHWS